MATSLKWLPYNTADTAVAGTALNALASGSFAYGAEIDNSTGLFTLADFELALSSPVTCVAPSTIAAFLLINVGTGFYTAASGNPGNGNFEKSNTFTVGSIQYMQIRGLVIPPYKFKFILLNNLGVALPSTNTSTAMLYRYSEQSV